MNHEDYKEMIPLYGLSAFEEAEERALEEHVTKCAECRAEIDQWRDAASLLAYAAAPAEPSPELRSRILESVRSLKAETARRKEGTAGRSTREGPSPAADSASRDSNVLHMPVRSWTFPQKILAIAASLAFVALLVSLFVVWSRNQALQAEVARLSRGLDQAQDKLARLEQDSEILNAPTLAVATLKGTSMAQKAQGKLMYDQKTGRAIFMASNMPPPPAGKAYQLWYLTGNRALPGGVFSIDASGRATMHEQLPPEARDATAFAVTLEPKDGVSAPTGEKYLIPAS
jgi:anti-sigma-K factor RskA